MRDIILGIILTLIFINDSESKTKSIPVPAFSSKSFLIAESDGTIIKEKNGDSILPIASITKLMVGLIAADQDPTDLLSIPSRRLVKSSIPHSILFLTRRELLTLALVKSDNLAAQVLCSNIPDCIDQMNNKAKEIGMYNTHYTEPTGLDNRNVSTVDDLLKLMIAADKNPLVGSISSMVRAEIYTNQQLIKINNTNPLTAKFAIALSKTGYTSAAGGCIAMIINLEIGKRIIILLGSRDTRTRISDMESLLKGL